MKKYLYNLLVVVALGCTVLLNGCKEKEVDPAAPVSTKLDNGAWNSKFVKAVVTTGNVIITATNASGDAVVITVKAAPGTYTLSGTSTNSILYRPLINSVPFNSNLCVSNPDGEIVVTEYDEANKIISGTFRAKLCNTTSNLTMTEGKFTKISF